MAEAIVVKFCVLAISSVSLQMTDHPWKRHGPGHVIHFIILQPL